MNSEEAARFARQVQRDAVVAKCEHIHRLLRIGYLKPRRPRRRRRKEKP